VYSQAKKFAVGSLYERYDVRTELGWRFFDFAFIKRANDWFEAHIKLGK
jgi:hypothetical protein